MIIYVCIFIIIGIILYHYFFSKTERETVTIYTCGGLGNQLFQICFGYSLSRKNNLGLSIIPSRDNVHTADNSKYFRSIFKYFNDMVQDSTTADYYVEPEDKYNRYIPELFTQKCIKSKTFAGYYQSEKYFIDYKDELIKIFTDNDVYQSVYKSNKNNPSYFIHIRRGDYLNSSLYINLDIYYENAINYVLDIDENAHFYIISDDIDYCKSYDVFQDINKTFYENQDELETLYFMSLCKKGGICCNSTFSWFGSYLNKNPKKLVIFPDKWDNNSWGENDIYYTNSIVLSTV